MIERNGGGYTVTCDRCPNEFREIERREAGHFRDAIDIIKREGWKVTRLGGGGLQGEWVHIGPNCARENHGIGGVQESLL